jgi:hypothetical protein
MTERERIMDRKTQLPLERMCTYHIDQIKSDVYYFLNLFNQTKNILSSKLELIDNEEICRSTIKKNSIK